MLGKGGAVVGKIEFAITQQRRRKWQPTSVFLPEKILASMDREEPGRLQSMRVLKESDVT